MKSFYIFLLLLFTGSAAADMAGNIVIEQAFVRAAIQQQHNSAAFMKITNNGPDAELTHAKSPVAKIVELHTHINDQGIMRMRKIRQIELPAKSTVTLQPGGLHVMLLGLTRTIKADDRVSITLGFSDGSEKLLQLPVRKMVRHKMKSMKGHK